MSHSEATCWTMIRGAAAGRDADRAEFSRRYAQVIRAYLAARWRGSALVGEIEDAVQDVFVDCFRDGGALGRADPERPGGFRAYLYGVVRHVAQRVERKRAKAGHPFGEEHDAPARQRSLSQEFDRAWAKAIMQQAARVQGDRAKEAGPDAVRRVEILRLRFQEGLPIREIAKAWSQDPARLHREYAKARTEFRASLVSVVAEHLAAPSRTIEAEAERLIACFQ